VTRGWNLHHDPWNAARLSAPNVIDHAA
jgi:hypothetical protein